MQTRSRSILRLAACGLAVGCVGAPTATQAEDLAEYAALQHQLDGARQDFLGDQAGDTIAFGDRVFWLDHSALAPVLDSHDDRADTRVTYTFSIGSGDDASFVGSATAVATAERRGDSVRYSIYDATQPARLLGTVDFEAPTDNQKYWAYALDGDDLYVVTTGAATTLHRFASGSPTAVTTLESAGCAVGEFWDFTMTGPRMIFIESGRIWSLDLPTNTAVWLGNETEATAGIADVDGVIFATATGPYFYRYASAGLTDLRAAIADNPYRLNETFAASHLYLADLARYREWFLYIANAGIFAYDTKRDRVVPVLLSPHGGELRVDYRYPIPTATTAAMFVTGLESTSGAVGADGPIYRLDLAATLE